MASVDRTDLDGLLRRLAEADGSDLHLKAGSPPRIRVNGDLVRLGEEPVVQAPDLEVVAKEIMHELIWAGF